MKKLNIYFKITIFQLSTLQPRNYGSCTHKYQRQYQWIFLQFLLLTNLDQSKLLPPLNINQLKNQIYIYQYPVQTFHPIQSLHQHKHHIKLTKKTTTHPQFHHEVQSHHHYPSTYTNVHCPTPPR